MIALGQENRLGRKAFFLLLSKRATPGVAVFVIAIILSMVVNGLSKAAANGSLSTGALPLNGILGIIRYVSYGLEGIIIISLLLIIFGFLASWIEYRNYCFVFNEFNLLVKRGIFHREEVSLPYRQMQDINIDRSVGYQLLGVSRLVIDSAGHEEADEHNETDIILEPLDKTEAEEIRTFLERRIGVQIVRDEKEADAEAMVDTSANTKVS